LSGLTHGEAGDGYHNVCPPETEPAFMRGYGLGRKSYELRSRMNSLLSDISVKEMEIDRLYDEMKNTADDLKRRSLRDEIDQLDRDTRRARRDADDIEYQLGAVRRDIDWFRMNPQATLPMPGY
jgi:chromosome segregation ATPase